MAAGPSGILWLGFDGGRRILISSLSAIVRRQDTCLKECLLTNEPLLRILNKIMIVCMGKGHDLGQPI